MNNKKLEKFLIFACVFIWVMMMGSKNVFTAELVEIMNVFNVSKPDASLAMTYYFITYSTMQVILFFIMDNVNVKWYMFISIFFSGLVTVLIAFATGMWQLWWILALNGILQASVWGMCLAVLNKYLPKSVMPKANMIMNIGTAVAGIISYGSSAIFVALGRWDLPFVVLGIILSISAVIFFIAVQTCQKQNMHVCNNNDLAQTSQSSNSMIKLDTKNKRIWFFILTFIFSVLAHFVFYGTMNWMPNLLTENFGVKNSVGILISILAPLATVLGPIMAIFHCEKHQDFIKVSLVYLLIATALSFLMIFAFNINVILAVTVLISFLVVIQGVVTIVFSVVSIKMSKYINAGAHAGLMNAAGGYSAGFAPTIVGVVIECAGWRVSYILIFAICLLTLIGLFIVISFLKRKPPLCKQ